MEITKTNFRKTYSASAVANGKQITAQVVVNSNNTITQIDSGMVVNQESNEQIASFNQYGANGEMSINGTAQNISVASPIIADFISALQSDVESESENN